MHGLIVIHRLEDMQAHDQRRFVGTFGRISADANPPGERYAQDGFLHAIHFDQLRRELLNLLGRVRKFDFEVFRAPRHALQMLGKPKGPAMRDAHRFE